MMPGPRAASNSKVRRRNLLIEWMVLLIQYTRGDAWARRIAAQEEISLAGSSPKFFPMEEQVVEGVRGRRGIGYPKCRKRIEAN
jgi:hypothetical protein